MSSTYKTITTPTEGLFKDRGSKFLAYAYPFVHKDQLKEILSPLKKEHIKAVHFCYAYRIGTDGLEFRANDDGEPSGSAGKPILGQIDSFGFTNILIVVVRYFGGTLLGVPGLINAYKSASIEALSQAEIIEREIEHLISIEFDYNHLGEIMNLVKYFDANIAHQDMGLFCKMTISVPLIRYQELYDRIEALYDVKILD